MKNILILIFLHFFIFISYDSNSQQGILVNPYLDYSGFTSPTYINSSGQVLELVHLTTNVNGFSGEYEINLTHHQWSQFLVDHVATYDFEVVGFPFTMNCAFQPASCADCSILERKLNLPETPYDNSTHTWSQYLYNDMETFGYGRFNNAKFSVLAGGWHQTLVSDFFNKDVFNTSWLNRIYFPHTTLKLNLYLHCNDNYNNPGPVIAKVSYLYDNTRGRMSHYPFKEDNCAGSAEANYDVIFRPTAVNSTWPTYMYYDDFYQDNSSWTEGLGTINYHSVNEIDLNGDSSISAPSTSDFYWEHLSPSQGVYYKPFLGPYSLQTCHLFGSEGKSLAGYNNEISPNVQLTINQGIKHEYRIEKEFELSDINNDEKVIYNPSKVILDPKPPQTYFNIQFPSYYTFKTIRGTVPRIDQVNADNIVDNGGPFFDLKSVPVRTDLRSEDPVEPHDANNNRHSVYSSIYSLNEGSQITIEPCVSLYDLCFDVNVGSTLIISDYPQIRGKEDKSTYPTGRFKIRGMGGAVLRNFAPIQYVQNGTIIQPSPLHYVATDRIIAGDNVSDDLDQTDGVYDIKSGANVTFEAGDYIQLTNGFIVSGGTFHAVINSYLPNQQQCFWQNREMNTENIVNSLSGTPALLINPNPAQSFVELQNISEQLDQFSVYIYDNLGRIVLQVKSSPNLKLDIDQLVPGIYSLHILESNQSAKFIKY